MELILCNVLLKWHNLEWATVCGKGLFSSPTVQLMARELSKPEG